MTEHNWKSIWNRREISEIEENSSLEQTVSSLLRMDGFDSPTGKIEPNAWLGFIKKLEKDLGMDNSKSIFEIGCGSGAFLFPFYKNGYKVGGIDFSEKLILNCKNIFENGNFSCGEAIDLSTEKKYDFIASYSVFFYFPNLSYATEVLHKMYNKAKNAILILDVPDFDTKDLCERARRGTMPLAEYEKKYSGLSHQYFSKSFFEQQATLLGAKEIKIHQQEIRNYINNPYRFNVIIKK